MISKQPEKIFNQPCYQQPTRKQRKVGEYWQDATAYYLVTMDGVAQYDRGEREEFETDKRDLEEYLEDK